MSKETGHDIVMSQIHLMQIYGRKGDMENAKVCLDSAKRIWEDLKDIDEAVRVNLDFYKKNHAHFSAMIGQ